MFISELLTVLEDESVALDKRLRIGYNAFNSVELKAYNKECVLLSWLSRVAKKTDVRDVWDTIHSCLTSEQMNNLKQSDVTLEFVQHIVDVVSEKLDDLENAHKSVITKCAVTVLKTDIFERYFKHNPKMYCTFVSTVLENVNEPLVLNKVVYDLVSYSKKALNKQVFYKYFLEYVFKALVDVLLKFKNEDLFQTITKVVHQCVLSNNSKEHREFFNKVFTNDETINEMITMHLINGLIEFYNNSAIVASMAFKTMFKSCMLAYKMQHLTVYKFFVLILHIIGFKVSTYFKVKFPEFSSELTYNTKKSLLIVSDIYETLSNANLDIDLTLNDIKYNDFIQNIVISILNMKKQPNSTTLQVLKHTIVINPLIIDKIIKDVLHKVTLCKKGNKELQMHYSELLTSIFNMYLKLHRIHKFMSELLRILKMSLSDGYHMTKSETEFESSVNDNDKEITMSEEVTDVLPENIMRYFQYCITLQSSKQVISIMRTLLSHLDEVVTDIKDYRNDRKKILYAQIVSELVCHFLLAVRVAEHTVTDLTVEKFCKDMEYLKTILAKYGTCLLQMEHNQPLIYCFLKICESWADMAILLMFYCPETKNVFLKDSVPVSGKIDCTACNITYLHKYLTVQQWSLVSQRIKNFGEKPCKQIMQKLILQKIRAMVLLEPEVDFKVDSLAIKSFTSNIENNWELILTEHLTTDMILPKLESHHIISVAELLVNDLFEKSDFSLLNQDCVVNSRCLTLAVLYTWFSKINSAFKRKRKQGESTPAKPFCTRIYKCIDSDIFIKNDKCEELLQSIVECYNDSTSHVSSSKIDLEFLLKLLELPKHLSILNLSTDIQKILFLYVLALCIDLRSVGLKNDCSSMCEKYLKGLLENNTSINMANILPADVLIKTFVENVYSYNEVLTFIVGKALRSDKTIESWESGVQLVVDNLTSIQYLELSVIFLKILSKTNKYKISEESKQLIKKYKKRLCKSLVVILQNNDQIDGVMVEAYCLTLQYYILNDKKKN